jgi:tRNA-2-methylthio-N6-dimethylallyladenosine synthase
MILDMFKYSERPNTAAARMEDDITEKTKQRRLAEVIAKQQTHSFLHMQDKIGQTLEVLIEGVSKKSDQHFFGRTTYNSTVVFDRKNKKIGDYVMVKIENCTSATLQGQII